MNLDVQKFVRKPFYVNAVQVTTDNIQDVALFCDGVNSYDPSRNSAYVKVDVLSPRNERQTRAYPGDWILKAGKGFRVYTNNAFHKSFDAVSMDIPSELWADAPETRVLENLQIQSIENVPGTAPLSVGVRVIPSPSGSSENGVNALTPTQLEFVTEDPRMSLSEHPFNPSMMPQRRVDGVEEPCS